jgi:hypothetical protein
MTSHGHLAIGDRWTCQLLSKQQLCNNVRTWQQCVQASGLEPIGCWQTPVTMPINLAGAG